MFKIRGQCVKRIALFAWKTTESIFEKVTFLNNYWSSAVNPSRMLRIFSNLSFMALRSQSVRRMADCSRERRRSGYSEWRSFKSQDWWITMHARASFPDQLSYEIAIPPVPRNQWLKTLSGMPASQGINPNQVGIMQALVPECTFYHGMLPWVVSGFPQRRGYPSGIGDSGRK